MAGAGAPLTPGPEAIPVVVEPAAPAPALANGSGAPPEVKVARPRRHKADEPGAQLELPGAGPVVTAEPAEKPKRVRRKPAAIPDEAAS